MNKSLSAVSVPVSQPASLAAERKKPVQGGQTAKREEQRIRGFIARQSGKLHSRFAGHMAFGAAVFVSMIAAATVASHDVPLMLGGF